MSYGAATGDEGQLSQLKGQVDQVKNVMRHNIQKVNEREQKLDDLDATAAHLSEDADLFQKRATQMRRKFWWQNFKLWMILICILVVIILVIAGIVGGVAYYFIQKK
ncbi:PREDICTED: vesicle-associated membrane protein 3-like [Amphimedon queenslandica]|uniref:V-SNARE coiled-coil homology domain-containing protein n=1 Tax=Amphimedon queenslandica TaxID=400682 RepID=A0A1X7TZV2_AMPQE|nr:PREDICTED: vesicle-associated membrane protein 3-like [Amphimedon queenslandica]|eukprot:XP_011406403.1 PREDICTED: vesicle-associated membrane protein 3-like [Amphimedon queenslandica]